MSELYERLDRETENCGIEEKLEYIEGEMAKEMDKARTNPPKRYPKGYVFDEDKSVRWNKEEAERKEIEYKNHRNLIRSIEADFHEVITLAIKKELTDNWNLNEKQVEIVYNKAYEDCHASGYYAVLSRAEDYADFYEEMTEVN